MHLKNEKVRYLPAFLRYALFIVPAFASSCFVVDVLYQFWGLSRIDLPFPTLHTELGMKTNGVSFLLRADRLGE